MSALLTVALATLLATASAADADALEEMVDLVEQRYAGRADRAELYRAAMVGFAGQLDRVTGSTGNALLSQAEWTEARAWAQGDRHGIGIEFTLLPGRGLLITDVFPGGPGEKSGLQAGDLVVGLEGMPFTGMALSQIHDAVVASAARAQVRMDVRRDSGLSRVVVKRDTYRMSSVRLVEGGARPCLRVGFFGEGAAKQLAQLLGDIDATGVVLDLRDNEGGLIDEAVAAADLFIEQGALVVDRVGFDGSADRLLASRGVAWSGAVVVLANRGTAGPAEAFVAALRDHGVAQVVGTATAGVGTLPDYQPLGDGLVLQLADTWMRSPGGLGWDGDGLDPDVRVEPVNNPALDGPGSLPPDLQLAAAFRLVGGSVRAPD